MWAANNTEVQIDFEATIPFVMKGRRLETDALVSPDIEEPMIGSEWMKAHRCLWDFQGSQLHIDGQAAVTLSQRKKPRCRRLYADQEIVVPARHQVAVQERLCCPQSCRPEILLLKHDRWSQAFTWVKRCFHQNTVTYVSASSILQQNHGPSLWANGLEIYTTSKCCHAGP